MRHVTVDEWSTRGGVLHRRDARAKLVVLVGLLVTISLNQHPLSFLGIALLLGAGLSVSRAPFGGFLLRVAALLLFPLTFTLLVALSGDPDRALLLFVRSGLSITAILLTVATTPMSRLLAAMMWFGVPAMLAEVVQFVYRYLFVLGEEAWHIRTAAALRGGQRSLLAAASSVGVLFGRAYSRAEGIHRSVASRSFSGLMSAPTRDRFTGIDAVFLASMLWIAAVFLLTGRAF